MATAAKGTHTLVLYRPSDRADTALRSRVERKRGARFQLMKGRFVKAGRAGANSFRFSGKLRGRRLSAGRYRLVARAVDPSYERSATLRARFSVPAPRSG